MIFTELRFLGFFLAVFALHWAIPSRRGRHAFLLVASYVFYSAWDVRFLGLIMLSTAVDYTAGRLLGQIVSIGRRKAVVACSLTVNLGLLGVFKYFNFFADSFVSLLHALGIAASHTTLHVILPVGISFYTFQSISYTVDVYRRKLSPERDLLTFATFVAFFPQLVAGPIVRAVDFLPQMAVPRQLASVAWRPMLVLFLTGFVKKAVLSDNLAPYVDAFFAHPTDFDGWSHWLATMLYATQIYCDFSGYTDMAFACAGLLGYHLCQNFNYPYLATSPRDFWRRWHISLSTWLRDYLYFSLGGSRVPPARVLVNLMLTMLLGGLWHGAAWTYVIWGALHGVALAGDHIWRNLTGAHTDEPSSGRTIVGWLFTMLLVLVAWVFFRAPDYATAMTVLHGMIAGEGATSLPGILWCYIFGLFAVHFLGSRGTVNSTPLLRLTWPRFAFAYGMLVGVSLLLVNTSYRPFIYFQF